MERQQLKNNEKFTFLIETIGKSKLENCVNIAGNIHGKVQKNQNYYVYKPGNKITMVEIVDIAVSESMFVEEACDCTAVLTVRTSSQMEKYAVLSNMKPENVIDVTQQVYNPYLWGLSLEYAQLHRDSYFMNVFLYVLCHSHMLIPTKLDKISENTGKGIKVLSLVNKQGEKLFPIFTDNESLYQWQEIKSKQDILQVLMITFPQMVDVLREDHVGIALNAFSSHPIIIELDLIEKVIVTPGYQMEFGDEMDSVRENQQTDSQMSTFQNEGIIQRVKDNIDNSIKKEEISEIQFTVSCPKQSAEVKLIRDALLACGKGRKEIDRIDLLLKVMPNGERSYLCIVDCPKDAAKVIFDGLDQMLLPYLDDVKIIDYAVFAESHSLEEALRNIPPVYIRV